MLDPFVVQVPELVEEREAWVEIRSRFDDSLVTTIEVLSPSNKSGTGSDVYRRKRQLILGAGSNLVDIDLLTKGERLSFRPQPPAAHFYAYVQCVGDWPNVEVYLWNLRDRLPTIPIPLRSPDPDVPLNLDVVYQTAFTRGGYPMRLRYRQPLQHLSEVDRMWASELAAKVT